MCRIVVWLGCGMAFFYLSLCFSEENKNFEGALRVAILGSGGAKEESGERHEVLAFLLKQIKEQKPAAVFYTGNLIGGLEQRTTPESIREFKVILNSFSDLVATHLGKDIPFYCVLGNHTFVNSEAVSIFRRHFNIVDPAPLASNQLAYAVVLDGVQFVVLVTGQYESSFLGYRSSSAEPVMPLFDWLTKTLRTGGNEIRYRFVVGHEPAFSSSSTAGRYTGMDKELEKRDLFWKVLKENGALGYLCSHESIYDRSNRGGVWQVISGGVSAVEQKGLAEGTFQHYIMLTVPKDKTTPPVIEAIGLKGNIWDKFELVPFGKPVHQFRISRL